MVGINYDETLRHVGEKGTFQKLGMFGGMLLHGFGATQTFLSIFLMAAPDFRCAVPGLDNDTFHPQSSRHQALINASIPPDPSTSHGFSQCHVYSLFSQDFSRHNKSISDQYNGTVDSGRHRDKCTRWVYDLDELGATLVEELDMVCDNAIMSTHSNLLAMVGIFVGSLLSGFLSDRFGRKPVMLLPMVFVTAVGICMVFVQTFLALMALRFLSCMLAFVSIIAAFTWAVEIVSLHQRALAGMVFMLGWAGGMLALAITSLLSHDWKILVLVVSTPACLLLGLHWIMPESPRWLICKGRHDEAEKVIQWIARVNRRELPDKLLVNNSPAVELISDEKGNGVIEIEQEPISQDQSILLIFKSRVLGIRFIVLIVNWIIIDMVYFGLVLNIGTLMQGSVEVNFLVLSIIEVTAFSLELLILEKIGRLTLHCPCLIVGGAACLAALIPILSQTDQTWITTVLCFIGKMGVTPCFPILFIITTELLPTLVRNSGLGVASFLARFGSMLSPYVASFHYVVPGPLGKALPLVVFGSLAILAGLLSLMLPETRGQPLPDTLEQAKALGRPKGKNADEPTKDMMLLEKATDE